MHRVSWRLPPNACYTIGINFWAQESREKSADHIFVVVLILEVKSRTRTKLNWTNQFSAYTSACSEVITNVVLLSGIELYQIILYLQYCILTTQVMQLNTKNPQKWTIHKYKNCKKAWSKCSPRGGVWHLMLLAVHPQALPLSASAPLAGLQAGAWLSPNQQPSADSEIYGKCTTIIICWYIEEICVMLNF